MYVVVVVVEQRERTLVRSGRGFRVSKITPHFAVDRLG
jgi:hypothetical protein